MSFNLSETKTKGMDLFSHIFLSYNLITIYKKMITFKGIKTVDEV